MLTTEIRKGALLADRYRIIRRVGAGGMATVFLAEDERLGREVAIKRLHTDAPKAALKRFEREARLGAALNHPNFVAVYDTVETDEGALLAMEYVPGPSLAELAAAGPMRPERAIPILRSVAEALDHAHSQDVVHRDVKPSNVIVRDDGVVKLADLGIARAVGTSQITSEGSVIGTLPYMAPERMEGPGSGGPESDVYALAAVAYELLSGQPPKEGTSTEELASERIPDLRQGWPNGPEVALAVLQRGLDPDPGRRQPSAGRLVEELDAALSGSSEAPTAFAPPEPATQVATRGRLAAPRRGATGKLNRGLALGLIGLAILTVAGIAIAGGGGGDGDGSVGEAAKAAKEPKEEPAAAAEDPSAPAPAPAPEEGAASDEPGALNDQGFALIQEGRYDEAIPLLERSVEAYGESEEIGHAYALFNLANALRLAGRPDEAIPYLQRRLAWPNQTGEVRAELAAAIAAAGGGEATGPGDEDGKPGKGNGNAHGHDKDD